MKITKFETKILDKQGDCLKGLAMLLVDVDYDGEIFDMDRTAFVKDISDDSKIRMTGLTESIAVIAIDKHGNESKTFIIKDDEFVKSPKMPFSVIPAKAGIRSFQVVTDHLDSGFHRSDDFLRDHQC